MAKNHEITPKKQRPGPNLDDIKMAVLKVVNKEGSVRQIALAMNLKKTTLQRHVNNYKKLPDDCKEDVFCAPRYNTKQVFSAEQEMSLKNYLIASEKMYFGLTRTTFSKFAYDFAVVNSITVPDSWKKNQSAGKSWLQSFFKRHPDLSIRKPEATNLPRCTSFYETNVNTFFDNLEQAMAQLGENYSPSNIFNLAESALTTVYNLPNIIAQEGSKQVEGAISAEQGTLVTACCIISAAGDSIPPYMIFPHVHLKDHMIVGAPPGI